MYKKYFLFILVTPEVIDTSVPTKVRLEMPTALACLANGFPVPSISWRKDGEEVNLYTDSALNARIDVIEFAPDSFSDNDFQSSGYTGNGSLVDLLMIYTTFTVDQVLQLGELGVVGLLSFEETVRGDTANYTCTATNYFPETRTLKTKSGNIQLVILGKTHTEHVLYFIYKFVSCVI